MVRNGEAVVSVIHQKSKTRLLSQAAQEDSHSLNFDTTPSSSHTALFPSFSSLIIALRHVAALLRKNFPEQRQKLCSLARFLLVLAELETGARRQRREDEDLFTATDSESWFKKLLLSHFPEASFVMLRESGFLTCN